MKKTSMWEVRCVRTLPDGTHVPQVLVVEAETETEAMMEAGAEIDELTICGHAGGWCIEEVVPVERCDEKGVPVIDPV